MRYLLLFALILFGCSKPQPKEVDYFKSCESLTHQLDLINQRLEQDKDEVEAITNRAVPLHIFVIALGITISVQPHMLQGSYYYVAPALTASYYNLVAASPDMLDEYKEFQDRAEVIKLLIEEKSCKTTN